MSVGGGAIQIEGQSDPPSAEVYALSTFAGISAYCRAHKLRLYEYVEQEEARRSGDFWNGSGRP